MLGDGVQTLQVQDQERPAAVQVRPELVHHQFFDIFAHGLPWSPRALVSGSAAVRWMDAAHGQATQADRPGLMVAETVTERMYVPLAAAGLSDRRWFRKALMFSSKLLLAEVELADGQRRRCPPCRCGTRSCPP